MEGTQRIAEMSIFLFVLKHLCHGSIRLLFFTHHDIK